MAYIRDIRSYWPKGKPLPANGIFFFYDAETDSEYKVLPEQLAPAPAETVPLTDIDSEHITDASEVGRSLLTSADAPSQLALLDKFSYPATADHAAFTRVFGDQGAMKYVLDKLAALGQIALPGAYPVVTGFLPGKGAEEVGVTITGSRFTDAEQVSFNGTPASFQVLNATTIQAVVPVGATTGPVAVTTPAGTGTSAASFGVGTTTPPTGTAPTILTLAPASGAVNALVAVYGSHLTGTTSVKLNGAPCAFAVISDSEVDFTVPAGASTGTVSVTTPAGTATSSQLFTVGTAATGQGYAAQDYFSQDYNAH